MYVKSLTDQFPRTKRGIFITSHPYNVGGSICNLLQIFNFFFKTPFPIETKLGGNGNWRVFYKIDVFVPYVLILMKLNTGT